MTYLLSPAERKQIEKFRSFLRQNGAELLATTGPQELVCFRANSSLNYLYVNDRGQRTMTGATAQAWERFISNKPYRFFPATPKPKLPLSIIERTILERDGPGCFYCGADMYDGNGDPLPGHFGPSREHLIARTAGGPDHLANTFLACIECNKIADSLSAPEKITLRERLRAARAAAATDPHAPFNVYRQRDIERARLIADKQPEKDDDPSNARGDAVATEPQQGQGKRGDEPR